MRAGSAPVPAGGVREQVQSELQRILERRMRHLIEERLDCKRDPVAAWRPKTPGRNTKGHDRRVDGTVGNEARRKFGARDLPSLNECVALAERYEVVFPGYKLSGSIDAAGEIMKSGGAVKIVADVVFTRPQQLDRRSRHLLGDDDGLADIIGLAAPAEAAS